MIATVRSVTLTGYLEVASSAGLDAFALLRRFKIAPGSLADPDSRIAAATVCDLLEESARLSTCPAFGLAMAECRTFASLGPVALLLEHVGTAREAVAALSEYRRHLNDILIFGIDEADGDEVVRVELLAKYATPQAANLALGVAYVALAGASRYRWRPIAIHFSHTPPPNRSHFASFFAAPVEFASGFNGFACSRESMDNRWNWTNATMAGHARRLLDLVPLVPEAAPTSDHVLRLITLSLASGDAALPATSARLGESPRSLQRALAREGRSFAELLNEVRRSVVIQNLASGNDSMTSIAAMLGFHSSSSFSRWFLAEFGTSPRAWRAGEKQAIERRVI